MTQPALSLPYSRPKPLSRLPGRFLLGLMREERTSIFRRLAQSGDVVQVRLPMERVVLISHPDIVQRVLVTEQRNFTKGRSLRRLETFLGKGLLTNEGESHLRQRRLAQPAFHRQRIEGYGALMADYADREQGRWKDGETRDIHEDMMRLTLSIAGKTLFDSDIESEARVVAEALDASLQMFVRYTVLPLNLLLDYSPVPWMRRLRRRLDQVDDLIYRMVAERRRTREDRGDLLSMLLAAQDDEGDHGGMSDQQLRDEILTILIAGHETTAVSLSWTWYLLAQHPEIEARLHAELDAVLGDRAPTVADIPQLTYTRQIIAESMRLYPPAWILERRATADFDAGGQTIRAGSLIFMSQFVIHRDPRWWPEPERFNPDRWAAPDPNRPKFAYFPFGAGTRICIGEQFAWMEAILVLATLARKWTMRHDPTHRVVPDGQVTLRPKYGMRMVLKQRETR